MAYARRVGGSVAGSCRIRILVFAKNNLRCCCGQAMKTLLNDSCRMESTYVYGCQVALKLDLTVLR